MYCSTCTDGTYSGFSETNIFLLLYNRTSLNAVFTTCGKYCYRKKLFIGTLSSYLDRGVLGGGFEGLAPPWISEIYGFQFFGPQKERKFKPLPPWDRILNTLLNLGRTDLSVFWSKIVSYLYFSCS